MKRYRFSALAAVACAVVSFIPVASAQQQFWSVAGMAPQTPLTNVADDALLNISVQPGSCYCCEIFSTDGQDLVYFSSSSIVINHQSGTETITAAHIGHLSPAMKDGYGRLCFSVPANLVNPGARLQIGNSGPPSNNVSITCNETTLYGGYNTSVTDFNFLELTSTVSPGGSASGETTAKVTIVNVVPSPDAVVVNEETISIPPQTRVDYNIHDRVGKGNFGTVKVCPNSPPGALSAVVSQYKITGTDPLAFTPVAQQALRTRSEIAGGAR